MEQNKELERRSTCEGCGLKLFLCELSEGVEAITCVNEDCFSFTMIRDVKVIEELRYSVRRYGADEKGSELQVPDQTAENNKQVCEQGALSNCNLQSNKKKRKRKRKRKSAPDDEENAKKAKIIAADLEVDPKRDESQSSPTKKNIKKKRKKKLSSTTATSLQAFTNSTEKSKETPVQKKKKKNVKPLADNDTKTGSRLATKDSTGQCSESIRQVKKEPVTDVIDVDCLTRKKLKLEPTSSMQQTSDTSDVSFRSTDETIGGNKTQKKRLLATDEIADTDSSSSLGTFLEKMAGVTSGNALASNQLSSECSSSTSKRSLKTSSDGSSFTDEKVLKSIKKQKISSTKKVNDAGVTDEVKDDSTEKESISPKASQPKKKRKRKKRPKQVADVTSNDSSSSSLSVAQNKEKKKLQVASSSAEEATGRSAKNLKVQSSSTKEPGKDAEAATSRSADKIEVKSGHPEDPGKGVTNDSAVISQVLQDLGCSSGSSNDMTSNEVVDQQLPSQVAGNGDMVGDDAQRNYYNFSFLGDLDIGQGYETCLTTSTPEDALVMINEPDLVSPCRFSSFEQIQPPPYQQHIYPPLSLEEMVEGSQKQTSPVQDNSEPDNAQADPGLTQSDQGKQSHTQEEPVQVQLNQSKSAHVPLKPVKTPPNQSEPVHAQVDPIQTRLDQSEPVIAQVEVVKMRQDHNKLQGTVEKAASPEFKPTHQSAKHSNKKKRSMSKVSQKKQHQETQKPSPTPMHEEEQIPKQVDETSCQQAPWSRQKQEFLAIPKKTQQTPQGEHHEDASHFEISEPNDPSEALAKTIADCRNDSRNAISIDESGDAEILVSIAPQSSIFSSRGMYQWTNESNLCWLDVIMTAFVNSYQVRHFINSRPHTRESSIYQTLCSRYDNAQRSGSGDDDDDIDERCELLTGARDEVVETLKRKMKVHDGQMRCAFRMFRQFLKLDARCTVRDLFTCTVDWSLDCHICGYEERRKMSYDTKWSGMLTLPNVPLDFHPFTNAYFRCPCCKQCKEPRRPMHMNFDRLGPLLSIYCKDGFRTFNTKKDLNEGKLDGICRSKDDNDGAHYHVYAVIVQVQKHFVLWLRDFKRKRWAKLDDDKDEYTLWRKTIRFEDDNPKEKIVIVIWQRSDVAETKASSRRVRKTDIVDLTVESSSDNSNDNEVDNHKTTEADSSENNKSKRKTNAATGGSVREEEASSSKEEKPSSIEAVLEHLERKRSQLKEAVDAFASKKIQLATNDDCYTHDAVNDDDQQEEEEEEQEEDLLDTGATFGENNEEEVEMVGDYLRRGDDDSEDEDVKVRVRNDRPKTAGAKVATRRSRRSASVYKPGSLNENSLLGQEALDHFRSPNNVYRPTVAMKSLQKKLNLPATPPDRMMEFVYDGGNKKRTKTDLEKFYEKNPPVDVVGGLEGKKDWISEHHFRKIRREHRPVDLFNYKDKDRFLRKPPSPDSQAARDAMAPTTTDKEDDKGELSDVASTASGESGLTPAPGSDAASSSGISSAGSSGSKRSWSRLEGEGRKFKPYRQVGNFKVCGYKQIDFGGEVSSKKKKTMSSAVRKRPRTLSTITDTEADVNSHHKQLPPEFAGTEYFGLEQD